MVTLTRDSASVSTLDTLQWLRQRHALTQQELAARVGVGRQAASAWETGAAQPHLEHLARLADVFRLTREDIFRLLERRSGTTCSDRAPRAASRSGHAVHVDAEQCHPIGKVHPGPSREDARILTCLGDGWSTAHEVARRLKISQAAAEKALWRAERRGLLAHRASGGYRVKRSCE